MNSLSLFSQQHREEGNGGCSQFIMSLLLFLLKGRIPYDLAVLQCGILLKEDPSSPNSHRFLHGLQFFRNCSHVGLSHRVQSFRSRLLQCGSHVGWQVPPENVLQHRLLMRSQSPSGIHLLQCGALQGVQVGFCSIMDLLPAGRKPASPWSSLWAAGEPVPGAPPAPVSSQTLVSAVVTLTYKFLVLSLAAICSCVLLLLFPLLTTLSQRLYHCC